ncbi:MAG: class I tRNA ligase family protein [Oscillospiraceae bacterium]
MRKPHRGARSAIKGCKRFLDRVWALQDKVVPGDTYRDALTGAFHRTIKKITSDIETLKFNTAIAALMALLNDITATGEINRAELKTFLILLNPFAPHITEEIFSAQQFGGMITGQAWVKFDEALCAENTMEIVLQINGKVRGKATLPAGASQDDALAAAKADERIAAAIADKTIVKEIFVKNKLVNIVVK